MGERMGKAERIEIEDFVQNIVERMETPEAFEKMISREEECEAQGRESRLRDVLKKEWPVRISAYFGYFHLYDGYYSERA